MKIVIAWLSGFFLATGTMLTTASIYASYLHNGDWEALVDVVKHLLER